MGDLSRLRLSLVQLVTRSIKAKFGQVGDQVGQVKDQVGQGQGQELDNYCLQMDDNDELDTIVMEDENEAEVKEEDEEQELIIIPFKETCSKHIRGFRRHSCLYKYRLICAWQQDSRQTCTCG